MSVELFDDDDALPTVQTGQKTEAGIVPVGGTQGNGKPFFRVEVDDDGVWHWMLFARNGKPMATDVVGYKRRNDCIEAFKIARAVMLEAPEHVRM